jgi:hypothetical protein
MLEGVEGEVGLAGGVGMVVDGDYAALFVDLVWIVAGCCGCVVPLDGR